MHRRCAHCDRQLTPKDFVKEESKGMETERRAMGLKGVMFVFYHCPHCGYDDIFVDVRRLPEESFDEFWRRRSELETVVKDIHAASTEVVLSDAR
jgi:hypothetical protein